MKAKNQIAIISGIVAILTTSVLVRSFNEQITKAEYGNENIKPNAQCGKSNSCDGGKKIGEARFHRLHEMTLIKK
jgi:hypothetical protein